MITLTLDTAKGHEVPPAQQTTDQMRDTFAHWHNLQVSVGDSDPHYPVIRDIGQGLGNPEEAAWLMLRMTSFYHLGSALRSYAESPGHVLPDSHLRYKTGTERRNHRVVSRFRANWDSQLEHIERAGGVLEWLTPKQTGKAGWNELMQRVTAPVGNGRYFGYKITEMAMFCLGVNIAAPDAGHAGSSGPRKGLQDIYGPQPKDNTPATISHLNALTEDLRQHANQPDVARIETSLCNFHSGVKGRYYIGKEIDESYEQLVTYESDLTPAALISRANAFHPDYLTEGNGRQGVERGDRNKVFQRTGKIVLR